MLGIMRKHQKSVVIKIVFGIIVLSFVGTIFLVWGKGDEMSGSSTHAAKVNGTKISIEEYQRSYYRLRSIYEQIYNRSFTPEVEKQLNLKKMALDSLIDGALVRAEAKKMGIKVSDDELKTEIAAMPEFQKNGAFDAQQYNQILKMNRLTPQDFEEGKRQDMIVKKAQKKVKEKVQLSDDELLQAYKKQHDKIDLAFVAYGPADVRAEVKLTDQDLNAYLQAHPDQFKTPEQVSIAYFVLDPATVAGKVTVTDEEAQTFYQKNIDRYQGKGGILPFAEVKDRAKADAAKAKASRDAYEKAADVLNKNAAKADIAAAAAALGAKVSETPLFTATAIPAALAGEAEIVKRAFSLKQGELGGPVETGKGIYLIKVKEKKPSAVPPLAQVRSAVEAAASADKARELAKKKAEETQAALAKGPAAVKTQDTGSFGYDPKGAVPKIGVSPDLMEAAFTLTSAAPAAKTPFKVGDRWYAVVLKSRTAADTADFAKSKDQIKQQLLPKKEQEALDAWLKELKAKAKIELNDALIAN